MKRRMFKVYSCRRNVCCLQSSKCILHCIIEKKMIVGFKFTVCTLKNIVENRNGKFLAVKSLQCTVNWTVIWLYCVFGLGQAAALHQRCILPHTSQWGQNRLVYPALTHISLPLPYKKNSHIRLRKGRWMVLGNNCPRRCSVLFGLWVT